MKDDRIVLYLNWDGFAFYYYAAAKTRGIIPVIESLKEHGVFFENAYCGIPAITNPMQTAIASGVYAGKTGNVKIYYDRRLRTVVGQRRENAAENLVCSLRRQGISCASVQHFTFENNGTTAGDVLAPYVFLNNSTYAQRFDMLGDLLMEKCVPSGDGLLTMFEQPRFVACYMEDLDTIGHNNGKLAPIAKSEDERLEQVLWRLGQFDAALGGFLDRMRRAGLLERLSLFLLTDHGMTPFSWNRYAMDSYGDFLNEICAEDLTYEVLKPGMSPKPDTDLVICSAGLSLLLTFVDPSKADEQAIRLKQCLEGKTYIGKILTGCEIVQTGSCNFCDLYISPKPPCILQQSAPEVGATHDSLDDTALHIFSLMYGSGIREGIVESRRVQNIDFASTMAALLDATPPRDNQGICLWDALVKQEVI